MESGMGIWVEGVGFAAYSYYFGDCLASNPFAMSNQGVHSSSFFFPTTSQMTTYWTLDRPEGSNCTAVLENTTYLEFELSCNTTAAAEQDATYTSKYARQWGTRLSESNKRFDTTLVAGAESCECASTTGAFYAAVEQLSLTINHYVSTTQTLRNGGALPKTIVRKFGQDSNIRIFNAGESVQMTLQELLQYAELDLDLRADEGVNAQWLHPDTDSYTNFALQGPAGVASGEYPYVRVSGVTIEIKMAYYNYRLAPGDLGDGNRDELIKERTQHDNSEAICIMTLRPFLVWTPQFEDFKLRAVSTGRGWSLSSQSQQYGVKATIEFDGIIASFSFFRMIGAFTQVFVLLEVCHVVVTLMAMSEWLMPPGKSQLYRGVLLEPFDLLTQYAQFSVQAVVVTPFPTNGQPRFPPYYLVLEQAIHAPGAATILASSNSTRTDWGGPLIGRR
ncbi:hypothetical protein CYMTET_30858, partial [Cymbomonas tetramitiformis]